MRKSKEVARSFSDFVANGHPAIVEVVPPAEDFQVVPVGHQRLCNLVNLLRLLRLASPLTEDDITFDIEASFVLDISLDAHEAGFLCVLEVVAVALGDLACDSLLDPGEFIYKPNNVLKRITCSRSEA